MFIAIMILLIATCLSILGNIYYNTISLQNTYGGINNYYSAYYGAISSVERGLLVSKIKYPGFNGAGGHFGKDLGISGYISETLSGDYGKLTNKNNSFYRTIHSSNTGINGKLSNNKLMYFSFKKYTDKNYADYKNPYNNQNIEIQTIGIDAPSQNISFSGDISINTNKFKAQGNTYYIKNTEYYSGNATGDFNRALDFGGVSGESWIIRNANTNIQNSSLLDPDPGNKKENNLGTIFYFKKESKNPRPTATGKRSTLE